MGHNPFFYSEICVVGNQDDWTLDLLYRDDILTLLQGKNPYLLPVEVLEELNLSFPKVSTAPYTLGTFAVYTKYLTINDMRLRESI